MPPVAPGDLPLVIQVGFAGARRLVDPAQRGTLSADAVEAAVQPALTSLLRRLPEELGWDRRAYRCCGVSQIAIGGDMLFTRACRDAGLKQRIFLPQHLDAYLSAAGDDGPDFTPGQQASARDLVQSPHVIQQRVVSDAADRNDRFHDVNLELVRECDLLICLVREGQAETAGGTRELTTLAKRRGCPVIELEVRIGADGTPALEVRPLAKGAFVPPTLPAPLRVSWSERTRTEMPAQDEYLQALYEQGNTVANEERRNFKRAAVVIIGAHVIATMLAVTALLLKKGELVGWLLGGELVLLGIGFATHDGLHRSHALQRWALYRLVAEMARASRAIGGLHTELTHLFALPIPEALHPLLKTMNVLHLHATAATRDEAWQPIRDAYVRSRLAGRTDDDQIDYNEKTAGGAERASRRARRTYLLAAGAAFVATATKLLLPLGGHTPLDDVAKAVAGFCAIVLPLVAVGALTLAAAFDLEAKTHSSAELGRFLKRQKQHLESASSRREFARLLIETETRLLGETATWYARRSFVGVA